MATNLSLGAALAARRRALRLTLSEAARLAGVSRATVAGLDRDQGQRASLEAVAGALGLRLVGEERLAAARERRGWSIPVVATRAGLTAPTVRLILAGGGRIESLLALAAAVGVRLRLVEAGAAFLAAGGAGLSSARDGSDRDEWLTPPDLLATVQAVLGVGESWDLDPCSPGADVSRHVPAARHVTAVEDALSLPTWGTAGDTVFVNPPFSRLNAWTARCAVEAGRGLRLVLLVPARPGSRWWREIIGAGADVVFLGKRLRFGGPSGARGPAPFDAALILFGWPPGAADRLAAALPNAWAMPARRVALAA